jgi:hypothetical protein
MSVPQSVASRVTTASGFTSERLKQASAGYPVKS